MMTWRQGLVFALGCVIGVLAGALVLMGVQRNAAPTGAQSVVPQAATANATACTFDPLLPAGGARDGQFAMPGEVTDKTTTDVTAYLTVGADAAAKGRVRDGEVAFITACRIAGQLGGADSVEVGESKYQLARHYTTVAAAAPGPQVLRREALQRAQELFDQSMAIASVKYGAAHEKTRLAAAGLVMARQASALSAQLASAAELAASDVPRATAAASAASAPASAAKVAQSEPAKKKPVVRKREEPVDTDTAPRTARPPVAPNTTEVGGPPASAIEAAPARGSSGRPEFGEQAPAEAGTP